MIKCVGLNKRLESNGVAFKEMTLVINKSSNESGEFFQIVSRHIITF